MTKPLCRADWPANGHDRLWAIWQQVGFVSSDTEPDTELHRKLRVALKFDHEAHANGDTIHIFEEMPRDEFDLGMSFLTDIGCLELRRLLEEGRNLSEKHWIPESVWSDPDPLAEDMEPPVWSPSDQKRFFEIREIALPALQNLSREIAWHIHDNPKTYEPYENRREQDDAGKPDPAAS